MAYRNGVNSIKKTSEDAITGDITLSAGDNITLTQSGHDIEIAATGGGDSLPDQTGNSGKFLSTDGTDLSWETPAGGGGSMDSFTLDADSGTSQTISDGNTLSIEGGTGIDTTVGATDKVTVALDSATQASLTLADSALQSGDLDGKVDKVAEPTSGHFAALDGSGNIADSGWKAEDFATASQGSLADSAVQDLGDLGITASATELNYVDGVTSDLQSQLDGKAASSHTHTASQITDFDTEVANNTDVAANTAVRHAALTVTDSSEIDFTLTGQSLTAALKAGSIDESKLDTSVNASLALADSATQPGDLGDLAAKDKAAVADIDATGTASSTTYLRGDGSWSSVSAGSGDTNYFNDYHTNQSGLTSSGLTALSGDVDGSNTTFTVSDAIYVEGTLQVYLNGVLQVLGDAITETTPASGVFDFVTVPASGSQIYVRYATQETTSDSVVVASDLAAVATSGAYSDLSGTPTIPDALIDLDTTVTGSQLSSLKTKVDGIASGAEVNTVDSVNTQTGAVVLDADDISDSSTTNKFVTSADITKLGNLSGTNSGDQDLSGYATKTGSETLTNKDLSSGTNTFPTFNQATTGNAATATKLATARTINGVSFDGSANITVADSTKVPTTRTVNSQALSSNVTLTQDNIGDGTTYKQYSATEKTKLSGIATGATANSSDATLKARANHTGTQALSTISDVTASAAEVNILDGVTATTAELNILNGVTATAAELNALDGITASVTELNYTDGVTSAIQGQLDDKVETSTLSASGVGFVDHGSTASTARPSGYVCVIWRGDVEPTNFDDDTDIWIDTSA